MAQTPEKPSEPGAPGDLRSTLIKRLAVAAGLVAVLLGVLAFFDYLATPEEPEQPEFSKPVPVPPKKEVTQPVTPAESLPEPPKLEAASEKSIAEKPVEPPPAPAVAPPAKPESPVQQPLRPAAGARELAKPATAHGAPQATPERPVPSLPSKVVPPAPPVEETAAPAVLVPNETRAVAPAKPTESLAPQRPAPAPAPLRLFQGYAVQAGIFTSVQRAEELHAKLTLNGVPSTLEARVQAGPFKTREEALAAREKLKALGIDAVVLVPPKAGR